MAKPQVLNEAGDDHDEPEVGTPVAKEEPKTPSARLRKAKRGNPRKLTLSGRIRQKKGK